MEEMVTERSIAVGMLEWAMNFKSRMKQEETLQLAKTWERSLTKYSVTEQEFFDLSQAVMEQFSYFPKLAEFLTLRREEYKPTQIQTALPGQSKQAIYQEPPLVSTEAQPEELMDVTEYRLLKGHLETWNKGGPEKIDKKYTKAECDQVAGVLNQLWQFGLRPARIDENNVLRFYAVLGGIKIRPECQGATWEDIKTRFKSVKRGGINE